MSEWTVLDPEGTPYGGERNNISMPIRHGGSGYEDEETFDHCEACGVPVDEEELHWDENYQCMVCEECLENPPE